MTPSPIVSLTSGENIRDKNIIKFLERHQDYGVDIAKFKQCLNTVKGRTETVSFEQESINFNKCFTIEINNIMDKNNFLGILIASLLLKNFQRFDPFSIRHVELSTPI